MSTNDTNRPGFVRRLLRAFLVTLFTLSILLILVVAGYFGTRELQRSFDSVTTRVSANEQSLALLRENVNDIIAQNPDQMGQIDGLQADIAALDERLANLRTSLMDQETAVSDLNAAVNSADEALAARAATLEEGLGALQSDLIDNTSQVDALGGDMDGVRAEVTQLNEQVSGLEQAAVTAASQASAAIDASQVVTLTVGEVQDTLILFRAWELVTRARLRLVESNLGLATDDIQLAAGVAAALATTFPEEQAALLTQAQTRLAQALANLPGNPGGAALDLEQAWDALDGVLALRIALPELPPTPEPTAVETGTIAPPVATPEPTPTTSP